MIVAFYRKPGEVVVAGGWREILDNIGQVENILCLWVLMHIIEYGIARKRTVMENYYKKRWKREICI